MKNECQGRKRGREMKTIGEERVMRKRREIRERGKYLAKRLWRVRGMGVCEGRGGMR